MELALDMLSALLWKKWRFAQLHTWTKENWKSSEKHVQCNKFLRSMAGKEHW